MSRTTFSELLLLTLFAVAAVAAYGEEQKTVWDFYEAHPRTKDFYAWGLYDIPISGAVSAMSRETLQYGLDVMAENGFTASWGHGYSHRFVNPPASEDDILFIRPRYNSPMPKNPVLSELGQWAYGELYPGREMKSLYCVQHWFRYNWPLFSESESAPATGPFLTEEELAAVETRTRGVLDFVAELGKTYPDTILGLVTDDEPPLGPGGKAAVDLLERNTGLFTTTIHPSWAGFKQWAPYMQPIGGDWYVTLNMYRESWVVAERLRWLNENHPGKVFLFMPLLTRYGDHDVTLPGLKDALTSRIELRLQIWQAVALGCKGVYGWSTGGGIEWAGAGASPVNALMQPTNGLWPELKALGLAIVPVGPLLLACQSDTTVPIEASGGTVRYPEFKGAAMDYGLLRDVRPARDRHFLVPWNNDINAAQTGTLALPPELLEGRKVYDILAMKEAALAAGNRLEVRLPPGGGRIYVIAPPREYAACRDTVLRHRVRYPRVMATMRCEKASAVRGLDMGEAERLIAEAKQAEVDRRWEDAAARYRDAVEALDRAEEKVRSLVPTKRVLEQLATVLSHTDELLRTHRDLLELTGTPRHWHIYPNKHAGAQMRDWITLVQCYFDAQNLLTKGKLGDFALHDRVLSLMKWAKANRQEVEATLDRRLKEVRKPVKVAFVTPDRGQVEYHNLYTRLYKTTYADWYAPDGNGKLACANTHADWINPGGANPQADIKGRAFVPDNYDAVFIHQILFAALPGEGEKVDPARALMPEILADDVRDRIAGFVANGGGLLLSGIAGLYANVLGLEGTMPDKVRENSYYPRSFAVGLAPAAPAAGHPVFSGTSAEGVFTNGNFPKSNLVAECAFETAQPSGRVIANERDDVFGRIESYAAIVEYHKGEGKVIVFGGKSCDYTPGIAFSLPDGNRPASLLDRLVSLTVNALEYLASEKRFEPSGASGRGEVAPSERVALPLDGWLFRTDPEDKGTAEGWYKPTFKPTGWKPLRVDSPWGPQGYPEYVGPGWYRLHLTAANKPGKRTLLHFAGVDEEAVVYVDGKLAGKHQEGPSGWNKPFSIDITKFLSNEPTQRLLSVRAENSAAAGGIWRPVYITYEK